MVFGAEWGFGLRGLGAARPSALRIHDSDSKQIQLFLLSVDPCLFLIQLSTFLCNFAQIGMGGDRSASE
jgi:hypothetical protein